MNSARRGDNKHASTVSSFVSRSYGSCRQSLQGGGDGGGGGVIIYSLGTIAQSKEIGGVSVPYLSACTHTKNRLILSYSVQDS